MHALLKWTEMWTFYIIRVAVYSILYFYCMQNQNFKKVI